MGEWLSRTRKTRTVEGEGQGGNYKRIVRIQTGPKWIRGNVRLGNTREVITETEKEPSLLDEAQDK